MRPNPQFAVDDPDFVRELIRENPWALIVSAREAELVASHYPIMVDEKAPDLTILTHLGRPDDEIHDLGRNEVMVIVQGRHGYISPSWYPPDPGNVPTWNFTAAHCYGVPQVLGEEENLEVLARLVAHLEAGVERPTGIDPERGPVIARGTVGLRISVSRFVCKRKLSQNKDADTRRLVIEALRRPGPYHDPELAAEMEEL